MIKLSKVVRSKLDGWLKLGWATYAGHDFQDGDPRHS